MKKFKWTTTILLRALTLIMLTSMFSCDDDDDDGSYGSMDELAPYEDVVHRKGEMNCYV